MKSLNKLIYRITIILVLLLIVAIFTNVAYVNNLKNTADMVDDSVDSITKEYSNINSNLIVIISQNNLIQDTPDITNEILAVQSSLHSIRFSLNKLDQDIAKINRFTFGIYTGQFIEYQKNIKDSLIHVSKLNSSIGSYMNLYSNKEAAIQKSIDFNKVLENKLHHIFEINEFMLSDLIGHYRRIGFTVIIALILSNIFIGLIMFRMFNKLFKYVLIAFKMMEIKNYDALTLPKFKPWFTEEKDLITVIDTIIQEQKYTDDISNILMTTYEIDDLMDALLRNISTKLDVDRLGIAFVDYHQKKIMAEYGTAKYDDVLIGPGYDIPLKNTSLSEIIVSKTSKITSSVHEEYRSKPSSQTLRLVKEEGINSSMAVPLIMKDTVIGILFFSSVKENAFDKEALRIAEKVTHDITGFIHKSYLMKVVFTRITNTFSELVDKKDNETGGHIVRMVNYSVIIAKGLHELGEYRDIVNKKFIIDIERHASSHDIGKVGIPDSILKKPGKLTPEEWEIMKTHAQEGGEIFKTMQDSLQVFNHEFFKIPEEIARHHHEKWDGSGYPDALAGQDIPLSARIIALADVFDALTSKRVYKKAFSFEESLEMVREQSGKHFDPIVVKAFLHKIKDIKVIYQTKKYIH